MPNVGLSNQSQKATAKIAPAKQNLSAPVQPGRPYLMVKSATTEPPAAAPTLCQLTALVTNIPHKIMMSSEAQMNHVAITG